MRNRNTGIKYNSKQLLNKFTMLRPQKTFPTNNHRLFEKKQQFYNLCSSQKHFTVKVS